MLPAANRGAGSNVGFPDVCLTPPLPGVPVPYTNNGAHCMAVPFSPTVIVCALPALNLASTIPKTTGDEPGILHPVTTQVGTFVVGCPTVFIDLLPAIHLTLPTTGNAMNCTSGAHVVPNLVNVFYNLAEGAPAAGEAPGGDEVLALAAALRDAPPPAARMLPGGVGLLRVAAFQADLPARVFHEVRGLAAEGLRALIVDVRDNPGGELDAMIELAGDFLAAGDAIVTVVDGDGDEVVHRARRDGPYAMPLVVLVSRGTASAAEVFAGALQARGRAVVVGEPTWGKGTAQSLVRGPGGDGFRYETVAACVLPGGASIEGAGVRPDVAVPVEGAGDLDADAALRAAWEVARGLPG